jgi:hypothetical protein
LRGLGNAIDVTTGSASKLISSPADANDGSATVERAMSQMRNEPVTVVKLGMVEDVIAMLVVTSRAAERQLDCVERLRVRYVRRASID